MATTATGSLWGSSLKALEGDLIDAGNRLLSFPSSTEELLSLLERMESLLAKVRQQPSKHIRRAILPAMKALIADDLLHNGDVNIQVSAASCFNELTRISAPDYTYPDDIMKEIFRLYIISLEQLSCESSHNSQALRILETMAKVKSFIMMVDMNCDGLVIEMFQIFLSNIRDNQQSDMFMCMESIMTSVLEESEISKELLSPLLESVKMDNKVTSPLSWELGRKVLENCARKLQKFIRKAASFDNSDYADIIASLAKKPSNRVSKLDRDSMENSFETSDISKQILQSYIGAGTTCGRKIKRSNPRKLSEENANHRKKKFKHFRKVFFDKYDENNDFPLPSEVGSASMRNDSSQRGCEGSDDVNLPRMKRILLSKDLKKTKRHMTDYGRELVGSRINVWWPMDGRFYPGKVKAFDIDTKKHVVLYDDHEVEILDLRKETWKHMVYEHHTEISSIQGADKLPFNNTHSK